jgi:predicted secreted hydrolase
LSGSVAAQAAPYRVWLEDWSVEETEPGVVRLQAHDDDIALDLTLRSAKTPVLHGHAGLSKKGAEPGNASYYYSQTRIGTAGMLALSGQKYEVDGLSWMDHEFGTSYLAENQIGWDWFSLQLDSGSELMYFEIRRADGSVEPLSGGTLVQPDGSTQHLERSDIVINVDSYWISPRTGARYPAAWNITVPAAGVNLDVRPYLADQELDVSYAYWEGAVEIEGRAKARPVSGVGYVELTGYAGSMAGEF